MRLVRLSRLWVLAVPLALAGCTDTLTNPTRLPPDRANFAVTGAEVNGDEVHLHFEGLRDRWWVDVGYSFFRVGILIDGQVTANIIGQDDEYQWDVLSEVVALPHGSTVLNLGWGGGF